MPALTKTPQLINPLLIIAAKKLYHEQTLSFTYSELNRPKTAPAYGVNSIFIIFITKNLCRLRMMKCFNIFIFCRMIIKEERNKTKDTRNKIKDTRN